MNISKLEMFTTGRGKGNFVLALYGLAVLFLSHWPNLTLFSSVSGGRVICFVWNTLDWKWSPPEGGEIDRLFYDLASMLVMIITYYGWVLVLTSC